MAIIALRRGQNQHQLIIWHLLNDNFTPGQWMRGDVRLYDLSPKGDLLLYFAAQRHKVPARGDPQGKGAQALYRGGTTKEIYSEGTASIRQRRSKKKLPNYMRGPGEHAISKQGGLKHAGFRRRPVIGDTWTAISKPPFFTALALWPAFGTWTGGGHFESARHVSIFERADAMLPHERAPLPDEFRFDSLLDKAESTDSRCATSPQELMTKAHMEFATMVVRQGLRRCDWVFQRQNGELLFSGDGRIFTVGGAVSHSDILRSATVIADFTEHRFEQVQPPDWATRW
ncbi:hypothetical protein ABRA89_15900 [Fulvimarina sp. MAC8]